jgi:carbon monoxide dehydrogenase subunit G
MEFDDAFAVRAPIEEVWAALLDVERVAPCMPGAEVLERVGDDAYAVAIRVKVGPIAMRYRGEVEIAERDAGLHRALLRARAREARGQGTAAATIEMRLAADGGDTTAGALHTDLQMSGRAAAMGRGIIQDVAARLVATFAANLATMLEAEPATTGEPRAESPEPVEPAAPPRPPPPAAGAPPPRPAPAPQLADADALPLGDLAASVVAGRLRDPRALAAAVAAIAVASLVLGWLLGRRSRA